jgi:4-alpha-glucanotransferase
MEQTPTVPGDEDLPLDERRAGVLLHVTSLPSAYGYGDLGHAAYRFVDFLAQAGVSVWQVLPLVPTHSEDRSPYNGLSALAGNPELVSLDWLADRGLLADEDLAQVRSGEITRGGARTRAVQRWLADVEAGERQGQREHFLAWVDEHDDWLCDYADFVALRESLGGTSWLEWEPALRDRDREALDKALAPLQDRLRVLQFEQYLFDTQWQELRDYAAERGVLVFGDLPIFVSLDSADVWAHRAQFDLDETGAPRTVTGVPPDYFSQDGQRWNNPHYDWAVMQADGFAWWRRRIARQRDLFDLVRLDHFRGFEASWHVPAEAETAREGEWVASPGVEVLTALVEEAGEGHLVAEDLGVITPEVDALRRQFGLPGMKVLQFAFDGNPDNPHLPHHHEPLSVAYTGTHDNDTSVGWCSELDDRSRVRIRNHQVGPTDEMPWPLIRTAMASVARLAVVPLQDLLGLGIVARMNVPGKATGNWSWQLREGALERDLDAALATRLRDVLLRYDRVPGATRQ